MRIPPPKSVPHQPIRELADLIYDDPVASRGVNHESSPLDSWISEMKGGIEVLVRVNNAADVEKLKEEMVEAHPDRGGSSEKFVKAYAKYKAALDKGKGRIE